MIELKVLTVKPETPICIDYDDSSHYKPPIVRPVTKRKHEFSERRLHPNNPCNHIEFASERDIMQLFSTGV